MTLALASPHVDTAVARRALLGLVLGAMVPGIALASRPAEVVLPAPESLAGELSAALAAGQPLVVLVSLDGCPFCKLVRQAYLGPLRSENGQRVVQIDMGSARRLAGFRGELATHDQLVRAWGVKTAPTVLFFGRGGREIAARLVGASIPDFYGAYLQDRLQAARRSLG